MKTLLELVLIPFVVGVAAEVVSDWLISISKTKATKNSLRSFGTKKRQ